MLGAIVVVEAATYTVVVVTWSGVVTGGTVVSGGASVVVVTCPGIVVGGSVVGVVVSGTVVVVVSFNVVVVVETMVVVVVVVTKQGLMVNVMMPPTASFVYVAPAPVPSFVDFTPVIRISTRPRATLTRRPPLTVIQTFGVAPQRT